MQLLGLMLLYSISALVVIAKFGNDLISLFCRPSQGRLLIVYGLALAAGVVLIVGAYMGVVPRSKYLIGKDLFVRALYYAGTFSPGKLWSATTFDYLLDIVNVVTGLAIPAFIAGGISCLACFKHLDSREAWIIQSRRLINYVYLSAGFLVIGTVFLKTWTQYPGYLLEKAALANHTAIVNAYTTFTGIEFTILLAAYALPVVLILSARGDEIARTIAIAELPAANPSLLHRQMRLIRERDKLTFSPQDVVKTIVAVLAPLITGSIASLSSILGKG